MPPKRITITLDPGHGNTGNQGINKKYIEGVAMYNLALHLKSELSKFDIFTVHLTKSNVSDNPSVENRGHQAVINGSNVFYSLHSDAFKDKSAKGVSGFFSLRKKASKNLLDMLLTNDATFMNLKNGVTFSRGSKTKAGEDGNDYYGVIRSAASGNTVDYVFLLEHGFHTNEEECGFLLDDGNLKELAKIEAQTFNDFFKDKTSPITSTPKTSTGGFSSISSPSSDTYQVNKTLDGFTSAENAMKGIDRKATVSPGLYFIFRSHNGSINVTNKKNEPGSWINPAQNKII